MKTITRGQITIAIIGLIGALITSGIAGWASASRRVSTLETTVSVNEERESNHYDEIMKALTRIEKGMATLTKTK